MSRLSKIADVLTNYAKGGMTGEIPKVHFDFTHDPTDIAGIDGWKLKVTLSSYENLDESGNVVPTQQKSWEATGGSDDECVIKIESVLSDFLKGALAMKDMERAAVESSLFLLSADATPSDLWAQDKAQAGDLEQKAENGEGWTNDPNSEPPADYIPPPDES